MRETHQIWMRIEVKLIFSVYRTSEVLHTEATMEIRYAYFRPKAFESVCGWPDCLMEGQRNQMATDICLRYCRFWRIARFYIAT